MHPLFLRLDIRDLLFSFLENFPDHTACKSDRNISICISPKPFRVHFVLTDSILIIS